MAASELKVEELPKDLLVVDVVEEVVEDSDMFVADSLLVVGADILVVGTAVAEEASIAVVAVHLGKIATHSMTGQWPLSRMAHAVDTVVEPAFRKRWCPVHRMVEWHVPGVVVAVALLRTGLGRLEMLMVPQNPCNCFVARDWTTNAAGVHWVHRPSYSRPINPLPLIPTLRLPSVLCPAVLLSTPR